jgi:hypothetical protein
MILTKLIPISEEWIQGGGKKEKCVEINKNQKNYVQK